MTDTTNHWTCMKCCKPCDTETLPTVLGEEWLRLRSLCCKALVEVTSSRDSEPMPSPSPESRR